MEVIKDRMIRFAITLLVSAGICIVGMYFTTEGFVDISKVFIGMVFGGAIWGISEFITDWVERIWPHKIVPVYVAMSLVILLGTYIATVILDVDTFYVRIIICVVSEIIGLLFMVISRNIYKVRLNQKLEEYKERG